MMTSNRAVILRMLLIWVLLELLAATQVRTADGTPMLWVWTRSAVSPVLWSALQLGEIGSDVVLGVHNTTWLVAEHRRLRTEVEELRARNVLLEEDRAALREATELLALASGFEASSVVGRCVYRNLQLGQMELRIGSRAVLHRDTPALAGDGLVGRVVASAGTACWLQTLTHPASAAAVQSIDGRVHGLATGSGQSTLAIQYVPRSAALLVGNLLVTSGADGIYPPGIPVAKDLRIRESNASFLEVEAVPTADLATARVVLLLTGWSPRTSGGVPRL